MCGDVGSRRGVGSREVPGGRYVFSLSVAVSISACLSNVTAFILAPAQHHGRRQRSGEDVVAKVDAEEESEAGKLLEKDARRFEEIGVPVSVQPRSAEVGRTASQIVQAAEEFGADAIVIGSRGRSALSAFVLGSVAQGVLRLAKNRVLVVH